jgi:hypothetical protein
MIIYLNAKRHYNAKIFAFKDRNIEKSQGEEWRCCNTFDYSYHHALTKTLSEWESSADDKAYEDL